MSWVFWRAGYIEVSRSATGWPRRRCEPEEERLSVRLRGRTYVCICGNVSSAFVAQNLGEFYSTTRVVGVETCNRASRVGGDRA